MILCGTHVMKYIPHYWVVGDASRYAGGGFLAARGLALGLWWQVVWPAEMIQRLEVPDGPKIAHLELAVLVLGLATLQQEARRLDLPLSGRRVLALSDNFHAAAWLRKCEAQDQRAAALLRIHTAQTAVGEYFMYSMHVPGIQIPLPDFISRSALTTIPDALTHRPCPVSKSVPMATGQAPACAEAAGVWGLAEYAMLMSSSSSSSSIIWLTSRFFLLSFYRQIKQRRQKGFLPQDASACFPFFL